MDMSYYAFALFIAALVCLIGILFKLLFGNIKQQRRLLEEKESNVLQLYQTVESIMDEFTEQIAAAMDDIKEYEVRAATAFAASQAKVSEPIDELGEHVSEFTPLTATMPAVPVPMTVDATRIRAASEVLERAERMVKGSSSKRVDYVVGGANGNTEVVQNLFDDMVSGDMASDGMETQSRNNREIILSLAEEGKTQAQIARQLGITQNEVKLVIDLVQHLASN